MAELEKKTAGQLIDDVASLIDIQLTDNTTPSRAQVVQWLNQGVIEVFRLVPPEELRDTMLDFQVFDVQFTSDDLDSKLLKVVSFKRNGVPCMKLDENVFYSLQLMSPYKYSLSNPAYTRVTFGATTTYKAWPGGKALFQLTYIPYPFVYATGEDSEEEEAPGDNAVPSVLESFVIEYAAIYARVQDEEPGQFQLYMNEWRTKLKMAHGIPVDTTEGG